VTSAKNKSKKQATQKRKAIVIGGAFLSVALIAVFFVTRNNTVSTESASAKPALAHIHGLGVDPSNNNLYAGTHYGTFRINSDGTATQIGKVRDYMGFTVVGPNRFLASGHPGADENTSPGSLGLIESTDGAKNWQTLSLSGRADFHALEARDGRIYGYNAGAVMVSEDGKTWNTRASLAMRDFAISPTNVDTLVATTQQGLVMSDDAGKSFTTVANTPPLLLVAWPAADTLVGVAADGSVQVSSDSGTTWQRRETVAGSPEALTATINAIFVATKTGVSESTDGGNSFTLRYRNS